MFLSSHHSHRCSNSLNLSQVCIFSEKMFARLSAMIVGALALTSMVVAVVSVVALALLRLRPTISM